MKAFRHLDISVFEPLMSLHPVFTGITAFLFLGEGMSRPQFVGIGCAVVGIYILETRPHHSLIDPLRQFVRSKYIHLAFFVLLIHAITSLVDRVILGQTTVHPFAYTTVAQCFLLFHFTLYTLLFRDGIEVFRRGFQKAGWLLIPTSFFTVLARFLQSAATKMAYVGLVIAIKHTSSFFSTIIGGELFHEKNLGRKVLASAIIISGTALIILS
jgi:drug/metabolite transporter (DMT)-like permease